MRAPSFLSTLVVGCALGAGGAGPAGAQTPPREVEITLDMAEAASLRGNPTLEASAARAEGAAWQLRVAGGFRWPEIEASAGVVRSDDPVAVFGMRLRQGRFGEGDFAVARLNDPAAASDWTAGVGARWSVGDPVKWARLRAADYSARAAGAQRERTAEAVVFGARMVYLEAVAAREMQIAAAAEVSAARETAQRVEHRLSEGMATEADRLQAVAALADATARLRLAEAAYDDAVGELAVQLGWEGDSIPVPSPGLPALADRSDQPSAGSQRADLRASAAGVEAARARASARSAARLPSIEAFGDFGTHAQEFLDDPSSTFTVGLRLSMPVFTGFQVGAGRAAAEAEAQVVAAEHRDRALRASAEVAAARRRVVAADGARSASRAARDAAREAVRRLALRYEEGMTTVAELLQLQARAAALEAGLVEAEARWRMALARLDFVLGDDPGSAFMNDADPLGRGLR